MMKPPHDHSPPHQYPQEIQLKLYQAFIFSIPILFSIILFLLFYLFYLKRRANSNPPPPLLPLTAAAADATAATTLANGESSDLKNEVMMKNKLCQILFDDCMGSTRDSLCCVCLGDFELKEELLQVEECKHIFHVDCIRHWLHNHSTCPLWKMTAGKTPAAAGGGGGTTSTQAYGEAWYWDNRYAQDPSTFDWYQKYHSLAPLIRLYIPRHHPILVVGCGNSGFSEGMADDGYDEVINVDISSVVIEAMQKKFSDNPNLKYMVMDVRDMRAFDTRSFAAVMDKGTLDSLLCGHNSRQNAAKMLEEVWRVLKDKGVYVLITYGSPVYRLPILKELSWTIKLHVIGKIQSGNTSNLTRDLTTPIPLDANGGSTETVGMNADVHYIYVCIKDESGRNEA